MNRVRERLVSVLFLGGFTFSFWVFLSSCGRVMPRNINLDSSPLRSAENDFAESDSDRDQEKFCEEFAEESSEKLFIYRKSLDDAIGDLFGSDPELLRQAQIVVEAMLDRLNREPDLRRQLGKTVRFTALSSKSPVLGTENISVIETCGKISAVSLGSIDSIEGLKASIGKFFDLLGESQDPDDPYGAGSVEIVDVNDAPPKGTNDPSDDPEDESVGEIKEEDKATDKPKDKPVEPAVNNKNPPTPTNTNKMTPVPFPFNWNRILFFPINGPITSKFGGRKLRGKNEVHSGIDFGGPYGTPVLASAKGVVARTGYIGRCGNTVIVQISEEYRSIYCHLSAIKVKDKQVVSISTVVGLLGSSGRATGPHVHLGLKRGKAFLNPEPYLTKRKGPKVNKEPKP